MRAITLALGLLIIIFQAAANGQTSGAPVEPPSPSLASTFISAHVEPLRQFRARRHLEATNRRFNKHGWITGQRRAVLALLTMRARAWVPSVSRLLSSLVNAHDYSGEAFFRADGAGARVVRRRLVALDHLSNSCRDAHTQSAHWGASVREGFSDIRFADANRVPFPFARDDAREGRSHDGRHGI